MRVFLGGFRLKHRELHFNHGSTIVRELCGDGCPTNSDLRSARTHVAISSALKALGKLERPIGALLTFAAN